MLQKKGEGAKGKDVKGDNPTAEELGRIRKGKWVSQHEREQAEGTEEERVQCSESSEGNRRWHRLTQI